MQRTGTGEAPEQFAVVHRLDAGRGQPVEHDRRVGQRELRRGTAVEVDPGTVVGGDAVHEVERPQRCRLHVADAVLAAVEVRVGLGHPPRPGPAGRLRAGQCLELAGELAAGLGGGEQAGHRGQGLVVHDLAAGVGDLMQLNITEQWQRQDHETSKNMYRVLYSAHGLSPITHR